MDGLLAALRSRGVLRVPSAPLDLQLRQVMALSYGPAWLGPGSHPISPSCLPQPRGPEYLPLLRAPVLQAMRLTSCLRWWLRHAS